VRHGHYCIYELRFSDDEAFRRVTAARLVTRFPALLDALASGELHLTGLLMLGPHFTETNLAGVLASAKHRTKREIARLVRVLDPLPAVPARIEPLGPAPARLIPGAPRATRVDSEVIDETALARATRVGSEPTEGTTPARSAAPARELAGPQRYKVQFTASEEYVKLIDEAKALLSHAVRNASIEDIQLRALRAFVAGLKKRKYAVMESSRTALGEQEEPGESDEPAEPDEHDARDERDERDEAAGPAPNADSALDANLFDGERQSDATQRAEQPRRRRRRGRHILAVVRRAVLERDGGRCSYVDARGRRCAETHRLQFHHLTPFARDGAHASSNLTLRCAPHNALAAEEDFGAELILARKFTKHESFCAIVHLTLVKTFEPSLHVSREAPSRIVPFFG
jgi:hypothetical protein